MVFWAGVALAADQNESIETQTPGDPNIDQLMKFDNFYTGIAWDKKKIKKRSAPYREATALYLRNKSAIG